jgi:uncharacterized glyoxalase superfamily protein PhnB
MADVKRIPDGYTGITPHLIVKGAAKAIDFYKEAFGAEELHRAPAPDGKRIMHAALKVANSTVYLCDDFPEYCGGKESHPKALGATSVTIHQYVEDAVSAVDRAVRAGAKVAFPVKEQFWGDIYGVVTDPFGHSWSFASHVKDPTMEEMTKAAEDSFKSMKPKKPAAKMAAPKKKMGSTMKASAKKTVKSTKKRR